MGGSLELGIMESKLLNFMDVLLLQLQVQIKLGADFAVIIDGGT